MASRSSMSRESGVGASRATRFIKGTSVPKPPNADGDGILALLMHPMNVLLICFPLGICSHFLNWGPIATFWLNFCSLIPLAKILGDATEELAAGLKNDMLAGLLNATFGNTVEMVIMVNTLRAGLIDVVKATLLGSVLSNLLLVLGMSFFCGGLVGKIRKHKKIPRQSGMMRDETTTRMGGLSSMLPDETPMCEETAGVSIVGEKVQTFSAMSALVSVSLLLLSCLSFSLVTVFHSETYKEGESELDDVLLPVSRICSIIIIIAYCAYIFFQLVTHRESMAEDEGEDDAEEPEEPVLSVMTAIVVMVFTTLIVAYSSELLVEALQGVVEKAHMSEHFIGIILLPIVGNACEHASAVRFAIMDKPGLSIGIAVGSSTQISLFVVPFSVLVGWYIGQPMDLNFGSLNTTVMSISVIVVLSVVVDGTANWLQGYLLISGYFIIAVLYWHLPNKIAIEV